MTVTRVGDQKFLRVMDANYNRAKEGLRVCEDACRFWLSDGKRCKEFKEIRHRLTDLVKGCGYARLLTGRDILGDQGRSTSALESRRDSAGDIFYANAQRVKESLRVLEEFSKLEDSLAARRIKALRYRVYEIEKKVVQSRAFHWA